MTLELQDLSEFSERVRELFDGLSQAQLTTKPTPEEFSFAEHVCHLRDIESEGYLVRIGRILTEKSPHLNDIDGARLAIERDYNRENIVTAFEEFSAARKNSIKLLSEADESQLSRTADLEGVGEIDLRRLVEMMHEHDASHLDEMQILRRRFVHSASV